MSRQGATLILGALKCIVGEQWASRLRPSPWESSARSSERCCQVVRLAATHHVTLAAHRTPTYGRGTRIGAAVLLPPRLAAFPADDGFTGANAASINWPSFNGSSEKSSKRPKSDGSSSDQRAAAMSFFLTSRTVSKGSRVTAMEAEE